jgi:hypothetical protein
MNRFFIASLLLVGRLGSSAFGQTTIINDNDSVTSSGTGFGLGAGVDPGINSARTRLTGSAAANLCYIKVAVQQRAVMRRLSMERFD